MKKSPYFLNSINNAMKILDILSVKNNIGVSEIAKIAKIDKTTTYKILYTLCTRDYVTKTEDAKYRLGIKFIDYGNIVASRQSLAEIAKPFMQNLVDTIHETVCLASLNVNGKVIISNLIEGNNPHHISSRLGFEMDAYDNANGKLLLAQLDQPIRESILNYIKFIQRTPYTVTSKEQLIHELNEIKDKPYVEQYEQYYIGHADIASPIYDSNGKVIAALSIACTPENLKKNHELFVNQLCRTTALISRRMGYYIPI